MIVLNQTARLRLSGNELRLQSDDGTEMVPSADEIYAYAFQGLREIKGAVVTGVDPEGLTFSRYPLTLKLELTADKTHERPDILLRAVAVIDGTRIFVPNILHRRPDHFVSNGTWYPFAKGSLAPIREIMRRVAATDSQPITLRQYLELTRIALDNPLIIDDTDHLLDAKCADEMPTAADLSGLRGHLYPYQQTGYSWLKRLTTDGVGCILADEMGLGKTIQIIALLVSQPPDAKPTLIIAPATILENWRRELEKFAPELRVDVHHGGGRTGFPAQLRSANVVLTSYDTAVRDSALFRMIEWNLVIVDEAQGIKNPETKRSLAIKKIPRFAGIAVTGTPVENRLTDLWSIADFVLPGLLGDRNRFESSFADEPQDASRLEPLVSPVLLRRRVSEVAQDLPDRIDIPQALELDSQEAEEYEKLRIDIQAEYDNIATLVSIGKLRQFCTHPLQVSGVWEDPTERSSKYVRLVEVLEEIFANREKALVFLHYHHVTDLFCRDLSTRLGVYADWIDGRVEAIERQQKIDQFTSHDGASVLLLNPRTAGTGLNLTAANHVIHYSPDWNPAVEDQASARAYRRGQEKTVTVHRFYFIDTVEEIIIQRLERKRELASRAVVGTQGIEDDRLDILKALKASPFKRSEG